jgi:hypothetical protein
MSQPFNLSELQMGSRIVLKAMVYAAGAAISALGGFHGYRGFRSGPLRREGSAAERLRDELVFGDDAAKLDGGYDIDGPGLPDRAAKRTRPRL